MYIGVKSANQSESLTKTDPAFVKQQLSLQFLRADDQHVKYEIMRVEIKNEAKHFIVHASSLSPDRLC
jgi:hypothetical protein